ncbi:MAG: CRISPR-associated helicase Cas3' [Clostridiales bacterium]|nr:CRISPR-associated helicase Cas3' [Clostridiales bacterium]
MDYLAHRTEDGRVQPLIAHNTGTAEQAAAFAAPFAADALAYQAGLLHDIGKYAREFQAYLTGNGRRVDHSTAGCKECVRLRSPQAAFCIAGHHAGLPDQGSRTDPDSESTFLGRIKRQTADYSAFSQEIDPPQAAAPVMQPLGQPGFQQAFFIRMLYSCLVDADFLDTEAFMSPDTPVRGQFDDLDTLQARLERALADFDPSASEICRRRHEILTQCRAAAGQTPGLFTLTVPTGGGKTLSSLAFALEHARQHGKQRIIYVIPYTSIIEQTADKFREILGAENVLEHHTGVNGREDAEGTALPERMRLAAENWDAPVIVTTNVQFFESLFAYRSSKCRKLHNLAQSVIIFDEAQMLPLPYLKPCVQAIAELTVNYHATAVLCTATQPALEPYFPAGLPIREIMDAPDDLYRQFQRVTLQMDGKTDLDALAQALLPHKQVLCIVNSRRKAQALYERCAGEGTYHLSTLMTPHDRRTALTAIRARLKAGQICRVISTTVIEAGVDVDFPTVYREISGLDSILQAAGRCNREGDHTPAESIVHIFELPGRLPASMEQAAGMLRETAARYADLGSPAAIRDYFDRLHALDETLLDQKEILRMFSRSLAFRKAAEAFRLIETDTRAVLVPQDARSAEIADALRQGAWSRSLLRQASPYLVSVYPQHFAALDGAGALTRVSDDLAILEQPERYDPRTGLGLDVESGAAIFI